MTFRRLSLLMIALCASGAAGPEARAQDRTPRQQIVDIAQASACTSYAWKDRGPARPAYMKGMALAFARAVCQRDRPDTLVVSGARAAPGTAAGKSDALTWYGGTFSALGMSNATAGLDTLRHSYVLLLGLGMRESSGKYCEGRDVSMNFTESDSAEAGLFQASWGAHTRSQTLEPLFDEYAAGRRDCFRETFAAGVRCKASSAQNWGDPSDEGYQWQALTKTCPAFAVEYAAVLIRVHGGQKGEFSPLRARKAEVLPACDAMFAEVQQLIADHPDYCASLK